MNILISTDCEPDDILAIHILLIKYRDCKIKFMVGEGKQLVEKASRLTETIGKDYEIILGEESKKPFPEIEKENGLEFRKYLLDDIKNVDLMIVLKPPREFFVKDFSIFEKTTLWIYGSFNFRCLFQKHSIHEIETLLNSFKNVFLYESFYATGEDNTVNKSNYEQIEKLFSKYKDFKEICQRWDEFRIEDAKRICSSIDISFPDRLPGKNKKELRYNRNRKCFDQISKNKGRQFVFSDVGLALTTMDENDYQKGNISFDKKTGYTIFTPDQESNKFIVKKKNIRELLKGLDTYLTF